MIRKPARISATQLRKAKAELQAGLKDHGKTIKTEFEDIVSDWSRDNRPEFVVETKVTSQELRVEVRPRKRRKASTNFGYVDKGTPAHVIRPKPSNKLGLLVFRLGYDPKTLPIAQAHMGTGKAEGELVFAKEVHHPGTKARLFSETVQKRTYPKFRQIIENAFRRIERRMNAK
jgi:hypothetical protein